jgi:hypothetical protein
MALLGNKFGDFSDPTNRDVTIDRWKAENSSSRSSLWGMATAGALGVGGYKSMKGRWGDLRRAAIGPGQTSLDIIGSMGQGTKYPTKAFSTIEALGELSVDPSLHNIWKTRIADMTYESLMNSNNPIGHTEARKAMGRITDIATKEGATLESVYNKAIAEINSQDGDTARFTKAVNSISTKSLQKYETARLSPLSAPLSKPGINEIITKKDLVKKEGAEFQKIIGRLGALDGIGDRIGNASFRRIGSGKDAVTMARIPITGVGDITLPLSINESRTMYTGQNYTTKYITRGAWDITGSGKNRNLVMKSYNEHFLDSLSSSISDDFGNKRTVKDALYQANRKVAQSMMDTADEAAGKAAIFAEDLVTSGGQLKQNMAMNQLVFGGNKLTPALLEEAIQLSANMGKPLTPFTGAGAVGKGALIQGDIRSQLYGGIGELFPAQKQPFQFLRENFGLSDDAIKMASQPGFRFGGSGNNPSILNDYVGRLSDYEGYKRANLVTIYATNPANVSGIMADEMGFMSKNVSELQSYNRIKAVTIRASEGMGTHPAIAKKLNDNLAFNEMVNFKEPVPINDPKTLGIDIKTNKSYSGPARGAPSEIIGFKRLDEGRLKIYTKEYHDMGDLARKYFGQGDVKHMIQGVPQQELENMLSGTGFTGQRAMGKITPEMYLTASRFKGTKNTAALTHQQVTAMQIMLAARADRTGTMSEEAKSFMTSPMQFLEENVFSKSKSTTISALQREVQEATINKAKSLGFDKGGTHFGMIFGAMDSDMANEFTKSGALSKTENRAIKGATHVIGMSAPSLGDLAFEGGSGKMGSMDVAGMRVLSQKTYSNIPSLGAEAAFDIAERVISPGSYNEIAKMHGSVIGADNNLMSKIKSITSADSITDLSSFNNDLVSKEGRWFSTGKAGKAAGIVDKIYIPGTDSAEQLKRTIETNSGELLDSQVHRRLASLRYALTQEDEGTIKSAYNNLASATHSEYAKSATSRGKVLGSRLLTGQQVNTGQQKVLGDAIGISKQTGLEMFDDLINRASPERRSFLESQKISFQEGNAINAIGWRHPNVGPESVQFLKMKALEGADDALVYMPKKMGNITIDGEKVMKDLSPLVGWKGDFDKDQFVLSVIGNERVEQKTQRAMNNAINAKYNKYLGTHYGMEELINRHGNQTNSTMRGISALREEARSHGYVKMATGQTNIALQKAKIAIASNAPELYDDMATAMWHLEETAAIGSKHRTIGGGTLANEISAGINEADENKIAGFFETVFGKGKQSITTTVEGEKVITTIDPQQMGRNLANALKQTPEEIFASVEMSQAAKGTSNASRNAMLDQFAMMQAGRSRDVAVKLATGGSVSKMGSIEGAFSAAKGKVRAVSQVLGRNKKPLLLGAAVAGVIAGAAPSISGVLKSNPNKEGAGGGRNINPEDIVPPGGLVMNPPQKGIIRSPRAYEMTSRVSGHYNADDAQKDNKAIMRQMAAARAGGANTRMSIQDNRSVLDSRMMANKIHERM